MKCKEPAPWLDYWPFLTDAAPPALRTARRDPSVDVCALLRLNNRVPIRCSNLHAGRNSTDGRTLPPRKTRRQVQC